jgi:hypothetical protein
MKKKVKCSGCGKEHEVCVWGIGSLVTGFTFEPIKSVMDKITEARKELCIEERDPDRLYLGREEQHQLMLEIDATHLLYYNVKRIVEGKPETEIYGFEVVQMNKNSYFHATSKRT